MTRTFVIASPMLLLSLLFGQAAIATPLEVGSQQLWVAPDSADQATWRDPDRAWQADAEFRLAAPSAELVEAVRSKNAEAGTKVLQIGIGRDVDPTTPLSWRRSSDGWSAHLVVESGQAEGLRLGLELDALPEDSELRVAGSAFPELIYATTVAEARSQLDEDGIFWTAVTDGERQHLEIHASSAGPATAPVVAVSHLLVGLHGDADFGKVMKNSGSCNIDAVCRVGTLGQPYETSKNAVARMVFSTSSGTGTCTGTLLNDLDASTTRLWFFSAHHCINDQSSANTLTTFWQNETPTCGSNQAGPNRQMTGGADLRHSSASTDALLLELRGSLPAGIPIAFAGWSAQPLPANAQVVAIHHPSGDRKKVSRGTFNRIASINIGGQVIQSSWRVNWSEGTTEGGSSGSGLFTGDANSFFLRGGLIGGAASCANSGQSDGAGNWDSYSRFDQVFPSIQQFIAVSGGGSNGPTRNYTGAWDVATEAGRGLTLYQFPQNNNLLFAVWFVYDSQGRASWYQLDPSWTGPDVASGRVVRWTGPAWGPTYNPGNRSFVEVGNFTLTFTGASSANFSYNVDGVNRSVTLRRLGD